MARFVRETPPFSDRARHRTRRGANTIRVIACNGQSHESAVGTSGHHYAIGIEIGPCFDPVEQCGNIFVGIFTLKSVVELQEIFSVTGRAAYIRKNDGATELVDKVIVAPEKRGPELCFWSAVNINDYWRFL